MSATLLVLLTPVGIAATIMSLWAASKQPKLDVGHGSKCVCWDCECGREAMKSW